MPVESPELGDAIVRMLRALVRRAGDGDTEALEQLARVDVLGSTLLTEGARAAYEKGYSWGDIGRLLGTTRQSAWERFAMTGIELDRRIGDDGRML